jgi:hypothetical protein
MSDPDPAATRNYRKAMMWGPSGLPEITRLPATFSLEPGWLVHRGAMLLGYLLFAAAAIVAPLIALFGDPYDAFDFATTIALPGLLFLVLLVAALWLPRRVTVTLTRQLVTVQTDRAGRRGEWTEPITAFAGLALRVKRTESEDDSSFSVGTTETTYYWIELVHPIPARTLILHFQKNGMAPLTRLEAYAKLLGREIVSTAGISRMTAAEATGFSKSFAETERKLGGQK